MQHINATTSDDVRQWETFLTQQERAGALRVRTSRVDPALPNRVVDRMDQFHRGVRIWGADVVRDSERGVPVSVFGVLAPELGLAVDPALTAAAATPALAQAGGGTLLYPPELVVLPLQSGDYRLAYTAAVSDTATNSVNRLFVDAQTGAELLRYSEFQSQGTVGTGRGVLGDNKKLSVQPQSGSFLASDTHRPPVIDTFDMRGNLSRTKLVLNGLSALPDADLATDADNVWTDPAVVDAHAHVGHTYDYFFKRFGRRGLDDRDRPIVILTNAVTQQGSLSLSAADSTFAVNAFFCGVCGPNRVGVMFFGNGIPSGFFLTSNGRNYTFFAGALDIVAHELTHGVTDSSSRLIYANESGALNEAFSDIMGKSVEFFYHPPGSGVGQADYVIGKDISRAVRPGALNGDRSLADPALYGDPDHYRNRFTGPQDNGGVHTNSGIANHAFFLAVEGGTNRTSGITVQGVGAANREQIERVYYRAFTLLMPANSTFVTARAATTQAARDLFGAGGTVERAVDAAWNAVGVPTPGSISSFTGTIGASSATRFAFTMNNTGTYTVNLRGNDEAVDLDLYLTPTSAVCSSFPFPVSCVLTGSESPAAVESIKHPVRAGESYQFWIFNLSGRSSSFTVEHFISSPTGALPPNGSGPWFTKSGGAR
jgi:bacillolysin